MDFHQTWYVDIVEIWFWIANGQILSIFELSACLTSVFLLPDDE